jgi:hypothetical protein
MTYGKGILDEGQNGGYDCPRAIIKEPKAPKKEKKKGIHALFYIHKP